MPTAVRHEVMLRFEKLDTGISVEYTVPAGTRLVIESVQVEATIAAHARR